VRFFNCFLNGSRAADSAKERSSQQDMWGAWYVADGAGCMIVAPIILLTFAAVGDGLI